MTALTAEQLAQRTFDAFLAKDMKGWTDLCAENVVAEFPFAPDGSPRRIEGRSALYDYLRGYPDMIDIHAIPELTFYKTDNPDMAIVEWSVTGKVLSNGNPYDMRYATFITFKDGLVANYREYWNPLAFIQALGGGKF